MIISCNCSATSSFEHHSYTHYSCYLVLPFTQKCRDVDGGEDGTIDQDILEDDYQNEDARVADTEGVEDVEMSYTKYEETTKDVNYALSQSPLD